MTVTRTVGPNELMSVSFASGVCPGFVSVELILTTVNGAETESDSNSDVANFLNDVNIPVAAVDRGIAGLTGPFVRVALTSRPTEMRSL